MKSRLRNWIVAALTILAILSTSNEAQPHDQFEFYSSKWYATHSHTADLNIGWKFSPQFPTNRKRDRVQEAFGKWNELAGQQKFNHNGEAGSGYELNCSGEDPLYNGVFERDMSGDTRAFVQMCVHPDTLIAHRFFMAFDSTRNWNSAYNESEVGANEWDYKSSAVHESGHATGFGGPQDQSHFDSGPGTVCSNEPVETMCTGLYNEAGMTRWRTLEEHDRHTFNDAYD